MILTDPQSSSSRSGTKIFSDYLRELLLQRCRQNRAYSLRAFAKSLGIEASHLSKILSKKRIPSAKLITKLALKLNLSPVELEQFIAHSSDTRATHYKNEASQLSHHSLTADQFTLISDWYHYAILELIDTKHFRSDEAWISRALSIPKIQVTDAIERMIRLELITRSPKGKILKCTKPLTTINNPFTNAAFRGLQKQILQQALTALDETPLEIRDQSSMTVAIDPTLIPEAKEKIKKFRRSLAKFLSKNSQNNSEVYQLSLSLFPVTQLNIQSTLKGEKL